MSNTTQFVIEQIGGFEGDYPDIPNRSDFQLDDGDTKPCYFTLPLGKAGTVSGNNNLYDHAFYQELVNLINNGDSDAPVRGIVGHPDPDKKSSETKLATHEWVGATLLEDGTVWGKAYVYPEETKIRAEVRRAAKRKQKVATSLRGNAVMDGNRATNPRNLWIDYVDPDRAGVKEAVATPIVTTEMINGDNDMSDNNTDVISELRNDRNQAIQELAEVRAELKLEKAKGTIISELTALLGTDDVFKRVSEMATQHDNWQPVIELLGDKPLIKVQEMQTAITELRHSALVHTIVDAIQEKVKYEGARPAIAEMMGIERDADGVATLNRQYIDGKEAILRLDALLERETVKEMVQSMVYKASGGRSIVAKQYEENWQDEFVEAGKRRASSIMGGNS